MQTVEYSLEGTWPTSISQIPVDPRPERRSLAWERKGGLQECRGVGRGGGMGAFGSVVLEWSSAAPKTPKPLLILPDP